MKLSERSISDLIGNLGYQLLEIKCEDPYAQENAEGIVKELGIRLKKVELLKSFRIINVCLESYEKNPDKLPELISGIEKMLKLLLREEVISKQSIDMEKVERLLKRQGFS